MSLKTFFMHILPFLFDSVEKEFEKLPDDEKTNLIAAGQFGQIIKTELDKGYDAIVTEASTELGWTNEQTDTALDALATKLGVTDPVNKAKAVVDHLQAEVNKGLEDSSWDALWTVVSGQLSIILGGGKVSWPVVAMGVVEFVYRKYVNPKAA
jgi:hypothetical protein